MAVKGQYAPNKLLCGQRRIAYQEAIMVRDDIFSRALLLTFGVLT